MRKRVDGALCSKLSILVHSFTRTAEGDLFTDNIFDRVAALQNGTSEPLNEHMHPLTGAAIGAP